MIRVSVMYPNQKGTTFDMTYYCKHHMPMVRKLLGVALKELVVEEGVAGGGPGGPAPYVAVGQLVLDSVESLQTVFDPHAQQIMGDIPNYTNSQPIIQISEIKLELQTRGPNEDARL